MRLFKYDNYQLSIEPEALTLKPFKVLWDRDKSKNKIKALDEFGFIYFLCDPRSEYQFITDEDSRKEEIKKAIGFPEKWDTDKEIKSAIDLYKQLTQTTTSLALEDTRISLEKVRSFIRNYDVQYAEDPFKAAKEVIAMGKLIPDYVKKITEMEKTVAKEIEESTRMRGGDKNKKLFEDGFDGI